MRIEPGQQLLHYRLIEKIGEGGMGVVWRALDTTLDREIALKVLPDAVADDPERLARFEREAKALAALDHPNIVTIHSVQQADDQRFITMELVRGRPLADAIPAGGLPFDELLRVSLALADALDAAHEKGVIHRDLKPANIMVGPDGRVRVLDFGLVKLTRTEPIDAAAETRTASATRIGEVIGTLPYMSPEQLKGEELDPRTDVFSLGVSLYEMATGRHPFAAKSRAELVAAILTAAPAPVHEVRTSLPAGLGAVVARCLEKDPQGRPTAREIRNELAALQRRLVIAGGDASEGEPAQRAGRATGGDRARDTAVTDLGERLRKAIEEGGDSGRILSDALREQDRRKTRQEALWLMVGGAVTAVAGMVLVPFLYYLVPAEPVWPVGLLPLLVGVVLIAWGGFQLRSSADE